MLRVSIMTDGSAKRPGILVASDGVKRVTNYKLLLAASGREYIV